jgi:hypothetical protein
LGCSTFLDLSETYPQEQIYLSMYSMWYEN